MKVTSFFKLLNRKINKYDKLASNPFESTPINITLVWVDESDKKEGYAKTPFDSEKGL